MIKEKEEFLEKIDKLLDCEGVLILKGDKSYDNFISTFFPKDINNEHGLCSVYKLRNIQVMYSRNPIIKTQTIVDLNNQS